MPWLLATHRTHCRTHGVVAVGSFIHSLTGQISVQQLKEIEMQSVFEIWFKLDQTSAHSQMIEVKRVTKAQALAAACETWDKLQAGGFYLMTGRPEAV